MSRMSTSFEDSVRETLEHFELPYEPSAWSNLEKRMSLAEAASRTSGVSRWIAVGAAATVTAFIAYSVYKKNFDIPEAKLAQTSTRFIELSSEGSAGMVKASGEIAQSAISDPVAQPKSREESGQLIVISESASTTSHDAVRMNQFSVEDSGNGQNENLEAGKINPSVGNWSSQGDDLTSGKVVISSNVRQACVGYDVSFEAQAGGARAGYLWNFGDGTFSSKPDASHVYSKPGVYDVSLSVRSEEDGSIKNTTMENMITINPTPEADFEWNFINGPTEAPAVKFINLSSNASQSIWTFDSGEASKEISPQQSFVTKGKYSVELFVKNEYGCTDSKVKYVLINSDYNLLAPEKFSPNGDGEEDTFMPQALVANNFNFKLSIYDQSGKPVFETNNKHKAWDGKLPDGSVAANYSHYNWIVILYNDITKEDRYFSGTLMVIP